jgi:hypothetical protein
MENGINGRINFVQEIADNEAKAEYMERCTKMSWNQLLAELIRVHQESARMLQEAYAELDRVNELLNRDSDGEGFEGETSH